MDFYIRVFVQIFTLSPAYTFRWRIPSLGFMLFVQFWLFFTAHNTFTSVPSPCSSASTVKSSPLKLAHVYQCTGCSSFHLQNIGRINSKVVFSYFCFIVLHDVLMDIILFFFFRTRGISPYQIFPLLCLRNVLNVAITLLWGDLYGVILCMTKNGLLPSCQVSKLWVVHIQRMQRFQL